MTGDISDMLKGVLDNAYSISGQLGLHPYRMTVVRVFTTGSRPGVGPRNVVQEPLTLANGQNPSFTLVSDREIFLSNNRLTDKHYKIGPLVPSYVGSCDGVSGGTDSDFFNPSSDLPNSIKQSLYIKVEGSGMALSGSFFKVDSRQEDDSLSYYLFVKDTGEKVQLT